MYVNSPAVLTGVKTDGQIVLTADQATPVNYSIEILTLLPKECLKLSIVIGQVHLRQSYQRQLPIPVPILVLRALVSHICVQ